jgi:hypothetical protein
VPLSGAFGDVDHLVPSVQFPLTAFDHLLVVAARAGATPAHASAIAANVYLRYPHFMPEPMPNPSFMDVVTYDPQRIEAQSVPAHRPRGQPRIAAVFVAARLCLEAI